MVRFICAQPSELYFVWQVEVMLVNFIEMGIDLNYVDIVCTKKNNQIPEEWKKLLNGYDARFFFYEDTRVTKHYISSIRPNILKQHFNKNPSLKDETIFYHDCDIVFSNSVNWREFENDNIWYGSNSNSYISYEYIIQKGQDIFDEMVGIVNIDPQIVIENNNNSIGAQYILKEIDGIYWENVEKDSEQLFKQITHLNRKKKTKNKEYQPLQIWCADMWAVLWNGWKMNKNTVCHPNLNFTWAKYSEEDYFKSNIFHNAGITDNDKDYFYKSNYTKSLPYNLNLKIKENTASKKYYEWIQKTEKKSVLLKNTLI